MFRHTLLVTGALSALLLVGCASKTTPGDAALAPASVVAAQNDGTPVPASSGVQSEVVPAPAGATLSTLDGKQLESVYFDYDSFTLKRAGRQALERNASWLQANPAVKITIEGHCDERGSDEYNLALGERRAIAVKNYLTALGLDAGRLMTISYGEERPAAAGNDENAWSKNRRAEFR